MIFKDIYNGIIYRVTELETGIIYIGQHKITTSHVTSIHTPLYFAKQYYNRTTGTAVRHFKANKKQSRFKLALGKYQDKFAKNFKIEVIIQGIESLEDLNNLEKFYIDLYNTRNPLKGYNTAKGGSGLPNPENKNSVIELYHMPNKKDRKQYREEKLLTNENSKLIYTANSIREMETYLIIRDKSVGALIRHTKKYVFTGTEKFGKPEYTLIRRFLT